MDDTHQPTTLPDDINQLKAMIAEYQSTIATLTQQRDEFYLKNLQLEVRLAKALKQAYGPRADRIQDSAQMLLDFGQKLEALPVHPTDLPPEEEGGMPRYKYYFNRLLTATENIMLGIKLSEYHTGYRTFTRHVLETLPLGECSDDFVFDNQMLAQAAAFGFRIGEISCPTRYFPEASSINFRRSVKYGFGVLGTALEYRLARWGVARPARLSKEGRRLEPRATAAVAPGPSAPASATASRGA